MATENPQQADFTVVVAIDEHEPSRNAFQYYLKYIHRDGNYVVLAHAMHVPSMPSREEWDRTDKAARRASQPVQHACSDLLTQHNINGHFEPGMEKPGEFIVDVANRHHARLVVMGTRDLGSIKRALLGSVSDHVMHHAKCPVLVVKGCDKTEET